MIDLKRRKATSPAQPLPQPTTLAPAVAMPVELLTVAQAASFAQVAPPTIRRWIREEGLRSYQPKEKGRVRIDKVDLVKFLKGETV